MKPNYTTKSSSQSEMDPDPRAVAEHTPKLRSHWKGHWSSFREFILLAKKEVRQAGLFEAQARWHRENAVYDDCIKRATEARQIYERNRLWHSVLQCLIVLCEAYADLAQREEMNKLCKDAADILHNRRNEGPGVDWSYVTIAELHSVAERFEEALQYLEIARDYYQKQKLFTPVAHCELEMGKVYFKMGGYEEAERLFMKAMHAFSKKRDFSNLSTCGDYLALVCILTGRSDQASKWRTLGRESIAKYGTSISYHFWRTIRRRLSGDYTERSGISSLLSDLLTSGRVDMLGGRFAEAELAFQEAIELIEDARGKLAKNDHRISFLEASHAAYHLMIQACFQRDKHRKGLEYLERLKTRAVTDMISARSLVGEIGQLGANGRGLRNRSGEDPRRRILEFEHMSYEGIKQVASLAADALVYISSTSYKTFVLVVFGDRKKADHVEVFPFFKEATLRGHVEKLASSGQYTDKQQLKYCIENLLEWLQKEVMSRISTCLEGLRRIVVIPFGVFHLVPLHAVSIDDGSNRECLLDKHLITYAPSAKILRACLERQRPATSKAAVFFSDPDKSRKLYHASRETDRVAQLFGTDPIRHTSREDLMRAGKTSHIIHYSGHADGECLVLHRKDGTNGGDGIFRHRNIQ